jgi:predicted nuclease of predicted toxin-antitoxin system
MFRAELAVALQAHGHDVIRATECGLARADDEDLLTQAISQSRVLVTLDGHFGDWAVLPLAAHAGVIRIKAHPTTSENVLRVLIPLLTGRTEESFANHLVIASGNKVRWIQTGD